MTNAIPFLQMTIKLSYGWRPLSPPGLNKHSYSKKCSVNSQISANSPNFFRDDAPCCLGGDEPLPYGGDRAVRVFDSSPFYACSARALPQGRSMNRPPCDGRHQQNDGV